MTTMTIRITDDEQLAEAERELAELQERDDRESAHRAVDLEAAILAYREEQRARLEKAYPPQAGRREE
jgi:hypothetical protein